MFDMVSTLPSVLGKTRSCSPFGQSIIEAIKGERPLMAQAEAVVADWMLGVLSGTDKRSLVQLADDAGTSRGYASKLQKRIAQKIKNRLAK
jgi:hypothetical protein